MLVFAGDRVRSGAYSKLHQRGRPAGTASRVRTNPGIYRWSEWSKDHPIFEPFDQPEHGDLRGLTSPGSPAWLPRRGPESLVSAEGKRRWSSRSTRPGTMSSWSAFPADNAWGDWAVGRLYLPLIHQIVGYLAGRVSRTARVRLEPAVPVEHRPPESSIDSEVAVVRNIDQAESDLERARSRDASPGVSAALLRPASVLPAKATRSRPPAGLAR